MAKPRAFSTEAELVAAFCECLDRKWWRTNPSHAPKWVQYHETAGWDLLLAHPESGEQVGIEAKLTLNAKVLDQALPGRWADDAGPDYRAVLVPEDGLQNHFANLAKHLGIVVITMRRKNGRFDYGPSLPDGEWSRRDWPHWCPARRCKLPDYIPDVTGGHAAPVALTEWKIKAIKLLILLDRRGFVTRKDMKALSISPTRWTDHWHGFLTSGTHGGYVRCSRTPDLKAQHPTNWAEIEADFDTWSKAIEPEALGFLALQNTTPADAESVREAEGV